MARPARPSARPPSWPSPSKGWAPWPPCPFSPIWPSWPCSAALPLLQLFEQLLELLLQVALCPAAAAPSAPRTPLRVSGSWLPCWPPLRSPGRRPWFSWNVSSISRCCSRIRRAISSICRIISSFIGDIWPGCAICRLSSICCSWLSKLLRRLRGRRAAPDPRCGRASPGAAPPTASCMSRSDGICMFCMPRSVISAI